MQISEFESSSRHSRAALGILGLLLTSLAVSLSTTPGIGGIACLLIAAALTTIVLTAASTRQLTRISRLLRSGSGSVKRVPDRRCRLSPPILSVQFRAGSPLARAPSTDIPTM